MAQKTTGGFPASRPLGRTAQRFTTVVGKIPASGRRIIGATPRLTNKQNIIKHPNDTGHIV